MSEGMQGQLMQAGIQGVQNTSNKEYNARQRLYGDMVDAMNPRQWLMDHFPNFYNWTPSGSGGAGYVASTTAPTQQAAGGGLPKSEGTQTYQPPRTSGTPMTADDFRPATAKDFGATIGVGPGTTGMQGAYNRSQGYGQDNYSSNGLTGAFENYQNNQLGSMSNTSFTQSGRSVSIY